HTNRGGGEPPKPHVGRTLGLTLAHVGGTGHRQGFIISIDRAMLRKPSLMPAVGGNNLWRGSDVIVTSPC
ncbi:MAG TPA: hypothetical protein QGF27_17685, partial [Arenicellales bacterium]|nr:hypothetical protein [Arenicellales bacterium]